MNSNLVSKVRRAVTRSRRAGGRMRYPQLAQRAAVRWLGKGHSPATIAEATGIGVQTLTRWSQSMSGDFRRVSKMAVAQPASTEISVEFANGVRMIYGSLGQLAETLEFFK